MADTKVSQHILDKKRQNRRQIIWAVVLATVAVLGMTYYDVRFRDYTHKNIPDVAYHYVASDADIAFIPDDYTNLTIWQGNLVPQPNGNIDITGTPVTPVNLPQRQIDLGFRLVSLPAQAQAELVRTIGALFHAWENKNNLVMDATIDIRQLDTTPVSALDNLLTALHEAYKQEYRYTLIFDPLNKDDMLVKLDDSALEKLMTKVYHLTIRVTPDTAAAAIAAADKLRYRFSVMVPQGTDINTFENDAAAKAKYFSHFIRDVTPPAP